MSAMAGERYWDAQGRAAVPVLAIGDLSAVQLLGGARQDGAPLQVAHRGKEHQFLQGRKPSPQCKCQELE